MTRQHEASSSKKAFTLIELLTVIGIISILAAILFPVFARARENARRASCMSNIKQIGLGIMMYEQDYDGQYLQTYVVSYPTPTASYATWPYLVQPYTKSTQVFNCPSYTGTPYDDTNPKNESVSYGMNVRFDADIIKTNPLTTILKPSETVLIGDSGGNIRLAPVGHSIWPATLSVEPTYRHLDTVTIGFADGHAKAMTKAQLQVKATSEDGQTLTGNDQFVLWNLY